MGRLTYFRDYNPIIKTFGVFWTRAQMSLKSNVTRNTTLVLRLQLKLNNYSPWSFSFSLESIIYDIF